MQWTGFNVSVQHTKTTHTLSFTGSNHPLTRWGSLHDKSDAALSPKSQFLQVTNILHAVDLCRWFKQAYQMLMILSPLAADTNQWLLKKKREWTAEEWPGNF